MDPLNKIDDSLIRQLTDEFGLPLHIIFTERISRNIASFREVARDYYDNMLVCQAVKANPCRGAVRYAATEGIGLDAVSEFELRTGLKEGISPAEIVCNGNAKSDNYIDLAVRESALIAIDSDWEIDLISRVAGEYKRSVGVLLRFAGMPLEGLTAIDQSTAAPWTKFGFPVDRADEVFSHVIESDHIEPVGVSAHIGTQICDASGYDRLMEYMLDLAERMHMMGMKVKYINIGGGFPVSYLDREAWTRFQEKLLEQLGGRLPPDQWVTWNNIPMGYGDQHDGDEKRWRGKAYWSDFPGASMLERLLKAQTGSGLTVTERLEKLDKPVLIIEPGRALIGTAGITVARVAGVKDVLGNNVVALELGIVNHGTVLITPDIYPVEVRPLRATDTPVEAFLAGHLCFTGDMISKVKVRLNRLPERGELLVIHHTGAYSADHFASNSCGFPRPAKVAVHADGRVEVWREAEDYDDLFRI